MVGAMSLIAWIFHAHHVASDAEQTLIGNALATAAFVCLEYWLIYLALEPWVRRYWPQTMITWSRVVAGNWRDPVVGRDLLFGTLFGMIYALIIALYEYANLRLGAPIFGQFGLSNLNGFRAFADMVVTLLPPPPPKAGTEAASPVSGILPNTSADPKEMTAVFYRPGDLKQRLQIPLGATLNAAAPAPEQMGGTEGRTVDSLTLRNLFNWSLPASQIGQPSLVLDRISG